MHNRALWTLDNETDASTFERLCTDLMYRQGYKDIIPVGGTHDRGRDAELCIWKGIKSTGGRTFFQYTLEKNWETKLDKELKKVKNNKHDLDFYVFLTIQKVTGYKKDKLTEKVNRVYGWQLIIYEREWFRLKLEEAHPDLALKYLGISPTDFADHKHELAPPCPENNSEKAWELYIQGKYEAAIVELQELAKRNKGSVRAWQALAWCQYSLYRYNEAIYSIHQALALNKTDSYSLTVKACILTEDGTKNDHKAELLIARDIFSKIARDNNHWGNHYNYGNSLHALGDYQAAKNEFLKAVELNPAEPQVWKNLGSVYFHLKNHEAEIECYDKALSLNPQLAEALVSKGVTLLKIFGKKQEAAEFIEKGISCDESISIKWPHAWYWLADALYENGDFEKALRHAETGLSFVPNHFGLLNLKASILMKLWRQDGQFIEEAVSFFKFRLELIGESYDSIVELVYLYRASNREQLAWSLLADFLNLDPVHLSTCFELTGISIDDLLISFRYLPAYKRFRDQAKIEDYRKYLSNDYVVLADNFSDLSFVFYGIPFGLACDLISKLPADERSAGIEKMKENIMSSFKNSLPRLAAKLTKSISNETIAMLADGFTMVLFAWPDIALRELSRQAGYIGSIFGVPLEELNRIIIEQGQNLAEWQKEILIQTLCEVNKTFKILKG